MTFKSERAKYVSGFLVVLSFVRGDATKRADLSINLNRGSGFKTRAHFPVRRTS